MRVAIYIRVSTEEQAQQGYSLDAQKERLIAFCKSQGWDEHILYMDDGYTGTNMNRPALKRLIRHIEANEIQTVLVYKLDRLGRKQKDVLHLLEDVFERNNVAFKSATEPFDTSTPLGKAMLGILAVFAQLERDMIVERMVEGRRQRVKQGLWHGGRIPFGYTWSPENSIMEIVPDEAHLIREIYRLYLEGQSTLSIADWAAQRSSARKFSHRAIRDILARPIYVGKLINNGALVDGKFEGIIDPDIWYAVQRETSRRRKGLTPIGDYLLTGLLECGVCQSIVVHVKRKQKRGGREYLYELYACKNQHVRPKERSQELRCWLGYRQRHAIEDYVISKIKSIALDPQIVLEVSEESLSRQNHQEAIDALKERKKQVLSGLDNLYDAIQSGAIKANAVSDRIATLEKEQELIETQLLDLIGEEVPERNVEEFQSLIQQIGEDWDYLTFEEQKVMVRKIIKKVTLNKNKTVNITWNVME
ncbi:recombinase family protein [Brevibacillus porteri]|uniref:Recombinase family protein n=1 Tax=Brevibacillus porteri TaxID=2126350 RepID=A0ABX5FRC4_9BACL|nr:recombinase family protein [Brevibacillus porteri]MED1800637.1 recombinase family protein [Brevibacillus porteri]MED2134735.1 recombinase family protein [Brevibacillus porteri]MED2745608.1 recombinase family protein [Brevibacillus porteri]MED2814754.1 recombinase family protein [Brevibacillus porteri]MED2896328.1 recombinase family protein [Brevibacillus porteri]